MNKIPIILDIFDFLKINDLQNFMYTRKLSSDKISYFIKCKKKFIEDYFPIEIQNSFPDRLLNYPIINFKNTFLDMDYYSKIDFSEIDYPISIGITNLNKPFIIIKYNRLNLKNLKNSKMSVLIIKRNQKLWSNAFSLKDKDFSITDDVDIYKKYYLYFDNNKFIRSKANKLIEKICYGNVIFAKSITTNDFVEYSLSY